MARTGQEKTVDYEHRKPGHPHFTGTKTHAAAGHVGTRILFEVPEPKGGIRAKLVERGELEKSGRTLQKIDVNPTFFFSFSESARAVRGSARPDSDVCLRTASQCLP